MASIHVYRLNAYELWAGTDLESVKAHYLKETGVPEEEAFEEPYELSPEELSTLRVVDGDTGKDEGTMAELLAKLVADDTQMPCFFAGSEY